MITGNPNSDIHNNPPPPKFTSFNGWKRKDLDLIKNHVHQKQQEPTTEATRNRNSQASMILRLGKTFAGKRILVIYKRLQKCKNEVRWSLFDCISDSWKNMRMTCLRHFKHNRPCLIDLSSFLIFLCSMSGFLFLQRTHISLLGNSTHSFAYTFVKYFKPGTRLRLERLKHLDLTNYLFNTSSCSSSKKGPHNFQSKTRHPTNIAFQHTPNHHKLKKRMPQTTPQNKPRNINQCFNFRTKNRNGCRVGHVLNS